jgi:hypothetical protein
LQLFEQRDEVFQVSAESVEAPAHPSARSGRWASR